MGKTYDLLSKSDMRRLERDLEKDIKRIAKESIMDQGIDIECPNCGYPMHARSGVNACPKCLKTTDVNFDWSGF